jgi:hypothetical protein
VFLVVSSLRFGLTKLGSDIRALDGEITGLLHSSHLFLGDDRGHFFAKGELTEVSVLYACNDEIEARVWGNEPRSKYISRT